MASNAARTRNDRTTQKAIQTMEKGSPRMSGKIRFPSVIPGHVTAATKRMKKRFALENQIKWLI